MLSQDGGLGCPWDAVVGKAREDREVYDFRWDLGVSWEAGAGEVKLHQGKKGEGRLQPHPFVLGEVLYFCGHLGGCAKHVAFGMEGDKRRVGWEETHIHETLCDYEVIEEGGGRLVRTRSEVKATWRVMAGIWELMDVSDVEVDDDALPWVDNLSDEPLLLRDCVGSPVTTPRRLALLPCGRHVPHDHRRQRGRRLQLSLPLC